MNPQSERPSESIAEAADAVAKTLPGVEAVGLTAAGVDTRSLLARLLGIALAGSATSLDNDLGFLFPEAAKRKVDEDDDAGAEDEEEGDDTPVEDEDADEDEEEDDLDEDEDEDDDEDDEDEEDDEFDDPDDDDDFDDDDDDDDFDDDE